MTVLTIDRAQARRMAVRAQLLDRGRETLGLLPLAERLTLLQLDPTAVIAPNADLVCWSRLGGAYRPEQLRESLERDRTLFEYRAMIRPMSDLPLFLPEMAAWGTPETARRPRHLAWLEANAAFHRYVLDVLRERGPLASRALEDRSAAPWPSSGWTDNRNVTQMLEILAARGEIAISGREGRQRLWDLAERVYPAPAAELTSVAEARRLLGERTLRSLGIARASAVDGAGREVAVEGVRGVWRVDPAQLNLPFEGRTALLSPFDRLIHDRRRMEELFGFAYKLEMYVPKADRRWGYFALPVLHGDELVGKVDAAADRKAGVLRVHAVHQDVAFDSALKAAVDAELAALASWLGLAEIVGR